MNKRITNAETLNCLLDQTKKLFNYSFSTILVATLLLLTSYSASAQPGTEIFYSDTYSTGTLYYDNDVNGKASYKGAIPDNIIVSWSGSRWEIHLEIGVNKFLLFFSNVLTNNNPPDFATGNWQDADPSNGASLLILSGTGTIDNGTLPVKLTTFSAEQIYSGNLLSWVTASEVNNQGFDIERSRDGLVFEKIGYVYGNGTTSDEMMYNYTDTNPLSGVVYYRLKQMDYDGAYEYSDIISVQVDGNSAYSIYPSATTDVLHISKKSKYSIINSQGQEVARGTDNRVNVSALPIGMYFIRLENGAVERFSKM